MVRIKQDESQQFMDQTRLKLLAAAAEEFARAGYAEANINIISTRAGYAKGTIYNYFPSKRALLLDLIDTTARLHLNFILAQVLPIPDPALRLERFYQAGFEFVSSYLAQARVLFNTINGPDQEFKARLFEAYQPMFQFLANEILALGIQQDIFRPVDPLSMAMLLMNIYLGTASQIDANGHPWMDPKQVADLALNGLHR